jgi:serine/threonine-protein kinase
MSDIPSHNTDHNLLFAVLALQADLIDSQQFVEVCSSWACRKDCALADLLVERGWLNKEDRMEVDRLLERKLRKHQGDVHASLAGVATGQVRQSMALVADPVVQQTLADIAPAQVQHEFVSTIAHQSAPTRDRYSLSRLHAAGGIGQVWLARDLDLDREVALKEIRPERGENPVVWARFLKEAKITGQLEHPGIVPVYELRGQRSSSPYYTMRFIRGRTLAEVIKGFHDKRLRGEAGSVDLHGLLTAFVAICNALAYAHARGVIHRDLKPQNVVVGDYGEVIVLDWGLAKLIDDPERDTELAPVTYHGDTPLGETMQGQVLGTPGYMAPEQAEGRIDRMDRRTDVYGLGAILYAILGGSAPFHGTDSNQVLRRVQREAPQKPRELWPAVPPALEAICLKALAKRPDERYGSAADLGREVQRWLADEPVESYPEPLPARAARWARQHKTAVAGAASLLLTAVVALVVGLVLLQQEQARTEKERLDAVAARDVANKNEHRALQAQQKADANATSAQLAEKKAAASASSAAEQRQLTLATLQGLVTSVQDQLESGPATAQLKEDLLQTALAGLEQIAGSADRSPASDLSMAEAYQRLGEIFLVVGERDKARQHFEKGLTITQELRKQDGKHVDVLRQAAALHRGLGDVADAAGKIKGAREQYQKSHDLLKPLWIADRNDARTTRELLLTLQMLADTHMGLGDTPQARELLEESLRLAESALKRAPESVRCRCDLAATQVGLGQCLLALGEVSAAQEKFRLGLEGLEKLESEQPHNSQVRFAASLCYDGLARTAGKLGKTEESLQLHEKARVRVQKLAEADPHNQKMQRHLMVAWNQIGDILHQKGDDAAARDRFQNALNIAERSAKLDPADVQAQHNLGLAYLRLASAEESLGNLKKAQDYSTKIPELLDSLLKAEPNNVYARRNLMTAYHFLGVLSTDLGDLGKSREYHQLEKELAEQLVAADPAHARHKQDLATACGFLGDALWTHDSDAALGLYKKAVELSQELSDKDPKNADARRDLGIAHGRLAFLYAELKKTSEARAQLDMASKAFAVVTPEAAGQAFEYDWANVYQMLGKVAINLEDYKQAREHYVVARKFAEKLVEAHPKNAKHQRALVVVLNGLGDIEEAEGNSKAARTLYLASLEHARRHVEIDEAGLTPRHDMGLGFIRLTAVCMKLNDFAGTLDYGTQGLAVLEPLAAQHSTNAAIVADTAKLHLFMGQAYSMRRDKASALAAFLKAVKGLEATLALRPTDTDSEYTLLVAHNQAGDLTRELLNDIPTCRSHYDKSYKIAQARATKADDGLAQGDLLLAYARYGILAQNEADFGAAEEWLKKGLKKMEQLKEDGIKLFPTAPRESFFKGNLTQTRVVAKLVEDIDIILKQPRQAASLLLEYRFLLLSRRGDHAAAAEAADKLRDLDPKNPDLQFNAARGYARACGAVAKDKKAEDLSAQQKQLRADYAARSVEALRAAAKAGYTNLARVEGDSDLAAIRQEAGYREVVELFRPNGERPPKSPAP